MKLIPTLYGRQFVCYIHSNGLSCISFGFHVDWLSPNIELHLPFCWIRIGWQAYYKDAPMWELGKKFEVVTNLRQASVNDEVGLVCLELNGEREEIKRAIAWLEELGVKVEPVEINTIEG